MSIHDTTPLGTQAAIVHAVLNAQNPRLALPTIASNNNMSLVEVQQLLHRHGYPDSKRMTIALERLKAAAAAAVADDTLPTTADPEGEIPDPRAIDGQLRRVPVGKLQNDPDNVRSDVGDVEELADSMREVGLLQPIVARRTETGALVVVAGHRRLAAARFLKWTDVPVIVRAPMRSDDVIAAMLIENGHRRDLDPIDEARGLHKLKTSLGLNDINLSRKVGRSQNYVSRRLALLNLTPEEQEKVRSGDLKPWAASDLGRLKAGKVRKSTKGHTSVAHLGPTHDLSSKAQARCKRLRHTGRKIDGGMACGACWESVIRADEREQLQTRNATADDCVTCGTPLDKTTHLTQIGA